MCPCADVFMFFKEASIHGGKRAKTGRKKVGKTLRVARAFRLSQLFIRNIASCSCREVAKSPSAPRCVGLTGTLTRHNEWKMIYFKMEHIAVASRFKGAMSQETGLEVPRCWPQYKRMFLVRAICIDIDSVGALHRHYHTNRSCTGASDIAPLKNL